MGACMGKQGQGKTTTPGTLYPTLCEECVGSLTSLANQYREETGDGAYGLRPYLRRLECPTPFADVKAKAAHSPRLF